MMLSGEQFPDREMAFKTTRFIDKLKGMTHETLPWRQAPLITRLKYELSLIYEAYKNNKILVLLLTVAKMYDDVWLW